MTLGGNYSDHPLNYNIKVQDALWSLSRGLRGSYRNTRTREDTEKIEEGTSTNIKISCLYFN
jgi:hypothetical protein